MIPSSGRKRNQSLRSLPAWRRASGRPGKGPLAETVCAHEHGNFEQNALPLRVPSGTLLTGRCGCRRNRWRGDWGSHRSASRAAAWILSMAGRLLLPISVRPIRRCRSPLLQLNGAASVGVTSHIMEPQPRRSAGCRSPRVVVKAGTGARTSHAAFGPLSSVTPPLRSCFTRAIALVMASASWRCAGFKYPALISLAIISLEATRKGD